MCPSEYSKDDDCLVDGLNSGEEDKPQEKLALSSSSPTPEEVFVSAVLCFLEFCVSTSVIYALHRFVLQDLLAGSNVNRSQVATGGGLSAEQLQELHKTDPKKVKRILANRSVGSSSGVSVLLDSASAMLISLKLLLCAERSKIKG